MSGAEGNGGDAGARYRALLAVERRYDGPPPRRRGVDPATLRRRLRARRADLAALLRADPAQIAPGPAAAIRAGQRARGLGLEIALLAARQGPR